MASSESSPPSRGNYVGSSLVLFLDQILVASSNWIFWIVISKMASSHEIGQSTTVYSLVLLVSTITQLGLEYPLLKKGRDNRSHLFVTTATIELLITLSAIPFVVFAMNSLYENSLEEYILLALGILVFSSLSFVTRFALLGIYGAREVLIIDLAGTIARFGFGYILVLLGYGTLGILVSFLIQFTLISFLAIPFMRNKIGYRIGNLHLSKEIIKDALINAPAKFSRTVIFSLSVVLLASFGISSSDVGIFYISLIISVVAGSLVSSMVYMIIPASYATKTDLSTSSMRLGLSLTAPIIVILVTSPSFVLSLIGKDYSSGFFTLIILSLAILPSSVVMISISRFNNNTDSKKLLLIGSLQLSAFLASFYVTLYLCMG